MKLPLTHDQLAERVARSAAQDEPLARLTAAVEVSRELASLGDDVLDRFVREARDAGQSWDEIGAILGVSRQAVHLRFTDRSIRRGQQPWPDRFSPAAQQVVAQSTDHARALGHNYFGTEHVLLALLGQDEDVAAQILHDLGLTAETVQQHIAEIIGTPQAPRQHDVLSAAPRLKRAFELARAYAKRLGHRHAGTELLLLGLIEVNGVATQILTAEDIGIDELRRQLARATGVDPDQLITRRRLPGLRIRSRAC